MLRRINRLIQADVHALLDTMEDPAALLKQSLREMEVQLTPLQAEQKHFGKQIHHKQQQLAQRAKATTELTAQVELCLDANDEVLARQLLRRRLAVEKQQALLQLQLQNFEAEQQEHQHALADAQRQFREVSEEAKLLFEHRERSPAQQDTALTVLDDEVELALLAEKHRRSQRVEEPPL